MGTLLRVAIATVWLVAGAGQLFNLGQPAIAGTSYLIRRDSSAATVLDLLPWFELGLGTLLLFGIGVRIVAALSATLWTALLVTTSATPAWEITLPFGHLCLLNSGCLTTARNPTPSKIDITLAAISLGALCVWLVIRPRCAATVDNLLAQPPQRRTRRTPSHAATTRSPLRRSHTTGRPGPRGSS